jgi:hypothetical protein
VIDTDRPAPTFNLGGAALAAGAALTTAIASAAIVKGYGVDLLGLLLALGFAVLCRVRGWLLAPAALVVSLVPIVAMTSPTHVAHIPIAFVLAGAVVGGLLITWAGSGIRIRPQALVPAVLLGAFGFVTGGVSNHSLHSQIGLVVVWLAGSCAGGVLAAAPELLPSMLWAISPAAVLAILECAGLPDIWQTVAHANAFNDFATFAGLHRALSTFGHPLVAGAVFLTLGILAVSAQPRHGRLLAGLYLVASLATVSRSSVVGIVAGLVAMMFFVPGIARRRALTALVAVAAVLGFDPTVHSALSSRLSQSNNSGRLETLSIAENSLVQHPGSVLFGRGFTGAQDYFAALGGNHSTGSLSGTLVDNAFVSGLYDFGLVPLGLFVVSIVYLAWGTSRDNRRTFIPPLVALATTLLFFDGLSWPSSSFFFFVTVGALVGGPLAEPKPRPEPDRLLARPRRPSRFAL